MPSVNGVCADTLAGDDDAVAAVEVFDDPAAEGVLEDAGVLARDARAFQHHLTPGAAADDDPLGIDRMLGRAVLPRDY
jgi:hypothetical protein